MLLETCNASLADGSFLMHDSVMAYVRGQVNALQLDVNPVLEVGSLDVNGSVRSLFPNVIKQGKYQGIDIQTGPGVDFVLDIQNMVGSKNYTKLKFPETIICTEMLEHATLPWIAVKNMHKLLSGSKMTTHGCLVLTTRSLGFPLHEYPWDCTRWTPRGLQELIEWAGFRVGEIEEDPEAPGIFVTAYAL